MQGAREEGKHPNRQARSRSAANGLGVETLDHGPTVAETALKRNQRLWLFNPHFLRSSPRSNQTYSLFKNDMASIYGRKNAQTAQKPEEKWPIHFCAF